MFHTYALCSRITCFFLIILIFPFNVLNAI
jgi:hypothetical protein